MQSTFHFYNDPGHGWMAVKRSCLKELGIARSISTYSYQRGDMVYLEEDSDYSIFLAALKNIGITPRIKEHHTERRSKIRSYDSFHCLMSDCKFSIVGTVHDPRTNEGMNNPAMTLGAGTLSTATQQAEGWAGDGYWASVYDETGEAVREFKPKGAHAAVHHAM